MQATIDATCLALSGIAGGFRGAARLTFAESANYGAVEAALSAATEGFGSLDHDEDGYGILFVECPLLSLDELRTLAACFRVRGHVYLSEEGTPTWERLWHCQPTTDEVVSFLDAIRLLPHNRLTAD